MMIMIGLGMDSEVRWRQGSGWNVGECMERKSGRRGFKTLGAFEGGSAFVHWPDVFLSLIWVCGADGEGRMGHDMRENSCAMRGDCVLVSSMGVGLYEGCLDVMIRGSPYIEGDHVM